MLAIHLLGAVKKENLRTDFDYFAIDIFNYLSIYFAIVLKVKVYKNHSLYH